MNKKDFLEKYPNISFLHRTNVMKFFNKEDETIDHLRFDLNYELYRKFGFRKQRIRYDKILEMKNYVDICYKLYNKDDTLRRWRESRLRAKLSKKNETTKVRRKI